MYHGRMDENLLDLDLLLLLSRLNVMFRLSPSSYRCY